MTCQDKDLVLKFIVVMLGLKILLSLPKLILGKKFALSDSGTFVIELTQPTVRNNVN